MRIKWNESRGPNHRMIINCPISRRQRYAYLGRWTVTGRNWKL